MVNRITKIKFLREITLQKSEQINFTFFSKYLVIRKIDPYLHNFHKVSKFSRRKLH